jgi:hypothetical protein
VKQQLHSGSNSLNVHIETLHLSVYGQALCDTQFKGSASHSREAPENVGLQKEQKCNTFACHTCNEVRLCFANSQKGSWQHDKII